MCRAIYSAALSGSDAIRQSLSLEALDKRDHVALFGLGHLALRQGRNGMAEKRHAARRSAERARVRDALEGPARAERHRCVRLRDGRGLRLRPVAARVLDRTTVDRRDTTARTSPRRAPIGTGAARLTRKPTRRVRGSLGPCVYCGRKRRLTLDHVPPQNLFAKPRPTPTVPSCAPCNSGSSLDVQASSNRDTSVNTATYGSALCGGRGCSEHCPRPCYADGAHTLSPYSTWSWLLLNRRF